jgi:hypothetical protein
MELDDLWKFILAVFGIGGAAVLATGAYPIPPSTSIYAEVLPGPAWATAGTSYPCIWEIHPANNKTINSVSFGSPGSWSACTQNTSDWLLWSCSSAAAATGNVTCPQIRVVQNEYPGTSETLYTKNMTFLDTQSFNGLDVTLTSGTVSNGTYRYRNLLVSGAITITGNATFIVLENITIDTAGSITVDGGSYSPYTLNVTALRFVNRGTLSGDGAQGINSEVGTCGSLYSCGQCYYGGGTGYPGARIFINVASFNNTGTITINGGKGGSASCTTCGGGGGGYYGGSCSAGKGGAGGSLTLSETVADYSSTGSVSMVGGAGGDATACCGAAVCSGTGGSGGSGGNFTALSLNFTQLGTVNTRGGAGAASAACSSHNPCQGTGVWFSGSTPAQPGGTGGYTLLNVSQNISIQNSWTATGGDGGAASVWFSAYCGAASAGSNGQNNATYCANGSGMDWTKFNPTATASIRSCLYQPVATFSTPNASTNITTYYQNLTSTLSTSASDIAYELWISTDNASSWTPVTSNYTSFLPSRYNSSFVLDTYRMGVDTPNTSMMRALAYNNTSKVFGADYIYSSRFTMGNIPVNVSGYATPNGTVSTSIVTFYCKMTNSTDATPLQAATAYLHLDGTSYAMSYDVSTGYYNYTNNNKWVAGNHSWSCVMGKSSYRSVNTSNTSILLSGFGIFYPSGYSSVKLTCPFPTIYSMTPAGQKAGIGIFRIVNYNSTNLKNYSLILNNTPPVGVYLYARSGSFLSGTSRTNWSQLSTTNTTPVLSNVNASSTNAYVWLVMDCVSVTPGNYTPVSYIFVESG